MCATRVLPACKRNMIYNNSTRPLQKFESSVNVNSSMSFKVHHKSCRSYRRLTDCPVEPVSIQHNTSRSWVFPEELSCWTCGDLADIFMSNKDYLDSTWSAQGLQAQRCLLDTRVTRVVLNPCLFFNNFAKTYQMLARTPQDLLDCIESRRGLNLLTPLRKP